MLYYQDILTLVRVPVLSEHIVLTDPRVSTVLRDLHRILFFFMMLAVIVRLAVTAIGRPSGMNATATLTQSTINMETVIQLGWSLRSHVALVQELEVGYLVKELLIPNDYDN